MMEKVHTIRTAQRPDEDRPIEVDLAEVEHFVELENGGAVNERKLAIVFRIRR